MLLDDSLTLVGLLFESAQGLGVILERELYRTTTVGVQGFEVLLRLARTPGGQLRMAVLARQTTLTRGGLTRAVDRLQGDGLVSRKPCLSDGRGLYCAITDSGMDVLAEALPGHLDSIQSNLLDVLSSTDRVAFERILRKIRDHVKPQ